MYISSMTKSELASFIKLVIKEAINDATPQASIKLPGLPDEFCTIAKVAERFKVTKATVHNWAKRGTIKKHRINGRTLYKISEFENVMK